MKDAFNASGATHLNKDELRQMNAVAIEREKAHKALFREQNARRPQDEAKALAKLLLQHPVPVLKPGDMPTTRPDFDKLKRDAVRADNAKEMKAALKPFEDKAAAIDAASRARQGLPPAPVKEEAAPVKAADGHDRLEPEEITEDYVRHVEALTEQENQQPGPSADPYPLSWPDDRRPPIDGAGLEKGQDADHDYERD